MDGARLLHDQSIHHPILRNRKNLKKNLQETVNRITFAIRHTDDRPIKLMFFDEARFGRITGVRACWAPKGIRPIVSAQIIREYTYLYTAVCPHDGESFSMTIPYVDAECMNIFLNHLAVHYSNQHVILVEDQASWHTAADLIVPDTVHFLFLPPHSPELNPTEHIWEYIREQWLGNVSFASMEELEDTLYEITRKFPTLKETFKSLCGFQWTLVNV